MNRVVQIDTANLYTHDRLEVLRDTLYSKGLLLESFYRTFPSDVEERAEMGLRLEAVLDIIEESSGFRLVAVNGETYYFNKRYD